MKVQSINPATEEVIAEYEVMSDDMIYKILEKAYEAYRSWRKVPLDKKCDYLRELARALRNNKASLSKLMTREMGKPITQAQAEIEKCAWTAEVYADHASKWLEEEELEADGKMHKVILQPLGVILSVMPWNFPIWQLIRFAIPTILVGNTALLKHSNNVPGCALAIEKLFEEAGFPEGVFATVIATHKQVENLLAHPYIQGVSLTGSTEAGARIAEIAGKNLKKVVLELGGSDPFIVCEDANLDFVIKNAIVGRTQNNGQSCIAAKRFIVHKDIINEFSKRLSEEFAKMKVGDPLDPEVQIGPLANKGEFERIKEQITDAENKGATILTGGILDQKGYFVAPTVVVNANESMKVVSEEVFGPVAPIIPFSTDEEAIEIANRTEFGLGGSVWTRDLDRGERIAREIEAGSVFVNSIVKSDPRVPFGGIKKSGIGRELSKYGLREFANIKALNIYESP